MYTFRVFCFLRLIIFVITYGLINVACLRAYAVESGVSFYLPGTYGDIMVAAAPAPGTYLLSTSIHYKSNASDAVLPNGIDKRIEAEAYAELIRGFWVPDAKFLDGQILMGFRVSALKQDVLAEVETNAGSLEFQDDIKGIGDLSIIPLSVYWQLGDLYINLYEAISIPTANFDKTRLANISLNRWVFDTVLAMSYLDKSTGIEISATPGIIYNSENTKTKYHSGIEFHMDAMVNWHISSSLSIGMHGSVYKQLTKDKGEGATLGSFKGRSYSIGPAIVWHKNIESRKYLLSAKWLHEFDAENKIFGDLTVLTLGIKF